MTRTPVALFACALTLFGGAAQAAGSAASVGDVKGEVLVASPSGVAVLASGAGLKAGDRVIARSGQATIRYADGCKVTLKDAGMATIADKSPCAGGPGLVTAASASPAQIGIPDWPVGAYFAGAGVVVIVGAILYGVSGAVSE